MIGDRADQIGTAGSGCNHVVKLSGVAVGPSALADIVRLLAECDGVHVGAAGGEQRDRFTGGTEFEIDVERRVIGVVVAGIVVGPHQQVTAGRNDVTGRDRKLRRISEAVGQNQTGQINVGRSAVVEFEPIMVSAVHRVGNGPGVVGHPFIDEHRHSRVHVVVGCAGRGEIKPLPLRRCAFGERAIGTISRHQFIVEVIDNPGLVANCLGQRQGTCHRRGGKTGVELGAG